MSGSGFVRRERESGLTYLADLAATVRKVWERACEHDGVAPDSPFVVFSGDNPFVQFHANAVTQLQEAQIAYRALGYVGLSVRSKELYRRRRRAP